MIFNVAGALLKVGICTPCLCFFSVAGALLKVYSLLLLSWCSMGTIKGVLPVCVLVWQGHY